MRVLANASLPASKDKCLPRRNGCGGETGEGSTCGEKPPITSSDTWILHASMSTGTDRGRASRTGLVQSLLIALSTDLVAILVAFTQYSWKHHDT